MGKYTSKELIAKRVADLLEDGQLVNLGVGIPTMVPEFLDMDREIYLMAENGIIGSGPQAEAGKEDFFFKDAGDKYCTIKDGGSTINSETAFGLIRGGHLDYTILGAMQVDEAGNLANWTVPGKKMVGMGGAMDLVMGANQVVIAMEHCTRDDQSKILKKCSYPLTGVGVIDMIITEYATILVTEEGLEVIEIAEGISFEELQEKTEARLIKGKDIKVLSY